MLWEENRLKVFEKRFLRNIFVTQCHNSHSPWPVITLVLQHSIASLHPSLLSRCLFLTLNIYDVSPPLIISAYNFGLDS